VQSPTNGRYRMHGGTNPGAPKGNRNALKHGNVLPVIRELQAAGIVRRNAIAKAPNARGVKTARGREWSHVQVGMVLARA
jgi:hypothetical protein